MKDLIKRIVHKNIDVDEKENLHILASSIWVLEYAIESINNPDVVSLTEENKSQCLQYLGNTLVKDFIFGDVLASARQSSIPEILGIADELIDLIHEVVSVCNQAGHGADSGEEQKIKEKYEGIKIRFSSIV